jgi:AcrR family transcriptional regulator
MLAWPVTLPPRPRDWPVNGEGDDHPPDRFAKAWKADGARMNETLVLTPERILEVTEEVLRRYGLAKATVVDVARALDVSHGSVYRHFPSKASLREAVAKRWLDRVNAPLQEIAQGSESPPVRLEHWLRTMIAIKHKKVCDDPEMFATYLALAQEACKVVKAHKDGLVDQIAHIISDGVKQGDFEAADAKASARALFDATIRFHHPAHAEEWSDPAQAARIDALLALLLRGLEAPCKH